MVIEQINSPLDLFWLNLFLWQCVPVIDKWDLKLQQVDTLSRIFCQHALCGWSIRTINCDFKLKYISEFPAHLISLDDLNLIFTFKHNRYMIKPGSLNDWYGQCIFSWSIWNVTVHFIGNPLLISNEIMVSKSGVLDHLLNFPCRRI